MTGERNMIRNGYRWDVIAEFNHGAGVRVATRKTRRGAEKLADTFYKTNRSLLGSVHLRCRYDPCLDDVMNMRSKRR